MRKRDLGRITGQSIINCLLHMRAEMVREGKPGLEHVNALLALRGALPNEPVPKKTDRRFRRGKLSAAVLAALRSGPLTREQLAERVSAAHGGMTADEASPRVYGALLRLRRAGTIVREGRVWWPPN